MSKDGAEPARRVVIVGGGTAGWMAAAALSRFLDARTTTVTLVESDEIGTVGVGEATIPTIAQFNRMLGIDEDAFLKATQGSFKLGIEFVDWGAKGDRYFHPFGPFGVDLEGLNFHQFWLKLRAQGRARALADYSLSSTAAARGRFARETGSRQPAFARTDYAFHFDASLYARFLRTYAEKGGVTRIEGRIGDVALDGEGGHVTTLALADGRTVAGDLFLDCSGFRGLLIEEALHAGYESWAHWLPCDRAVAVPTRNVGAPHPFTRATAEAAGWRWRIPLQHRTGNGYVYASAFLDTEAATRRLLESVEGEPLGEPRHLRFVAGRRRAFWSRNVVALGLAGGFLEPLESTSIHLIQTGIAKLLSLFPDRRFLAVERDTYNRQMEAAYEGVRDFIILHYHATTRDDGPFWDHVRTMAVPDSLAAKLELFRAKGRFFRSADELFVLSSWIAVMLGQGVAPQGYEPIVDALDDDRLADALAKVAAEIDGVTRAMPTHAAFLARHCAAAAA